MLLAPCSQCSVGIALNLASLQNHNTKLVTLFIRANEVESEDDEHSFQVAVEEMGNNPM
jgi:hypothetical protein